MVMGLIHVQGFFRVSKFDPKLSKKKATIYLSGWGTLEFLRLHYILKYRKGKKLAISCTFWGINVAYVHGQWWWFYCESRELFLPVLCNFFSKGVQIIRFYTMCGFIPQNGTLGFQKYNLYVFQFSESFLSVFFVIFFCFEDSKKLIKRPKWTKIDKYVWDSLKKF